MKYIGALATALGLGGLASDFLRRWLDKRGYMDADNAFEALVFGFAALARSGWFQIIVGLALLFMIVYWIAFFLSTYWQYRSKALYSLGAEMMAMAIKIRRSTVGAWGPPWPDRLRDLRPEMATLLERAKFYWIWVLPDDQIEEPKNAGIVVDYFDFVGSFLHKDMLKQARKHARSAREKIATS